MERTESIICPSLDDWIPDMNIKVLRRVRLGMMIMMSMGNNINDGVYVNRAVEVGVGGGIFQFSSQLAQPSPSADPIPSHSSVWQRQSKDIIAVQTPQPVESTSSFFYKPSVWLIQFHVSL